MSQKNPADVAKKWMTNLQASVPQIKAGVQALTISPTAQAAKQAQAYVAGVQQAVADGRWQAGLNAVSLPDWQNAMINKGVPRIASGATAAQPKVQAFMEQWLPYVNRGVAQLASTPRGSLEQNIQRMDAMVRYNANFKKTG